MHKLFAVLFITALALGTACTNDELCVGNGINEVKLSLNDYETGSGTSITMDSIGFSGQPISNVYIDTTVSFIGLPVDPDSTWTRFVFITTDRTDTLELRYAVTPSLISVDCGPELLFSNLDTLYHTFDSLAILQQLFDREVETNIEIFY